MSEIVKRQKVQKEQLLAELKKTPIVNAACKRAGVGRATYYRWLKKDSKFALVAEETLDASRQLINDMAESQLISAIKDQNMTAIIFWLKNNHRNYRMRMEINAKVQAVQQELSPEQQELVSRALQLSGLLTNKENNDDEQ